MIALLIITAVSASSAATALLLYGWGYQLGLTVGYQAGKEAAGRIAKPVRERPFRPAPTQLPDAQRDHKHAGFVLLRPIGKSTIGKELL